MPTDLLPLLEQAGRNQWLAIAPELMLGLIALLLLVLELLLPKAQRGLIPGIAIISQVAVLVALVWVMRRVWLEASAVGGDELGVKVTERVLFAFTVVVTTVYSVGQVM